MLIKNDFLNHWKVKVLCKRLGDGPALRALLSLWAYCEQRRAWEFKLSALELAGVCDYGGPPDELHSLLKDLRLITPAEDGFFTVNGWGELNSALVHKWPGRRLLDDEYWHPRGFVCNGAIDQPIAQPIAKAKAPAKGKAIRQPIGLDRIGLESTPVVPKGTTTPSEPFLLRPPEDEVKSPAKRKKEKGGAVDVPDSWSDARRATFLTWLRYKSERRQPYKATGLAALLNSLEHLSDEQLESTVQMSMVNGWSGLFPGKVGALKNAKKTEEGARRPSSRLISDAGAEPVGSWRDILRRDYPDLADVADTIEWAALAADTRKYILTQLS